MLQSGAAYKRGRFFDRWERRAMQPMDAIAALWAGAGMPPEALAALTLTGAEPALPSSFAVGTAAQATIALSALAAASVLRQRTGRLQAIAVDMRHAAVEFRSERYMRVDGLAPPDPWDRIAGTYPCGDGRWVRLHTNFPHHRDGVLALLGCEYDRAAVAAALRGWHAFDFEQAAAEAGMCVAAMRSFAEWDAHPQGMAIMDQPVVSIERIGDAPATAPPAGGERPLSGLRVLELTRVIAGPVCGRTLAAHGADVLLLTSPSLPSIPTLVADTGRGKRSAELDLRAPGGVERLRALLQDADVFLQGYRPGGLAGLGFAPADVARLRPGIVCVSLSAYGTAGPWGGRRGFDSLVQTATGFNAAEAEAAGVDGPKPLPAQANDHAAGYLLTFGTLAALYRRATEGGSWHVQVSLARTAQWIRSLGRIADGFACKDPNQEDVADLLEDTQSGFGRLTAVRHAARLAETPARWDRPSVPLGTDAPAW
jgi:crotonobetainyl-CoA:carnitine CoA-transferase CaiB-like acyl-CoA transferase